jgi:hypothetical protein
MVDAAESEMGMEDEADSEDEAAVDSIDDPEEVATVDDPEAPVSGDDAADDSGMVDLGLLIDDIDEVAIVRI